ncbi:hypothetical protein [Paenibacillus sp. 1P07SE]|uniref:hypothetical protein n=1 Tax=Paenibacillus sp. 1P07SE TaxID=3132209 RepID=UPI0039A5B544
MILVVEVKPGHRPEMKEIDFLIMGSYGEKLFNGSRRDHANLGNDLYVTVGDSSALDGLPFNFTLTNGSAEDQVYGAAVFVKRIWERDGETFDPYKALLPGEAAAIVELFKRNRGTFDTRELYKLLGWM